jgi:hypothetical protein
MTAELRYTRAGQSVAFLAAGILLLSLGAGLGLLGWHWDDKTMPAPLLPTPWLGVAPVALAAFFFWWAGRLVRRPLLVLTPVGIEVYPFIHPDDNMQLVLWAEIDTIEIDAGRRWLVITRSDTAGGKVFVSLRPLTGPSRLMLARAVEGTSVRLRAGRQPSRLKD